MDRRHGSSLAEEAQVTAKRRRKPYPDGIPNAWIAPVRRGYKAACCTCGLVHKLRFRLHRMGKRGYQIQMAISRDERATAAIRRHMKIEEWTELLRTVKKKAGRGKVPVLVTIRERTRYKKRKRCRSKN